MKKSFVPLIQLTIILIFCSCTNTKTPIVNKSLNNVYAKKGSNQGLINSVFYNDGVYVGEGDLKDYGKEIATITISDGKITEVIYQRVDSTGKELVKKCCNKINISNTRQKILKDDIESNIDLLTNEVIKRQSYDISLPTNNKDLLLNWKLAVKRAMEKAMK